MFSYRTENEDEDVQSPSSPKSAEFKSSYSAVILSLHTDVSRSEPASQSASSDFKTLESSEAQAVSPTDDLQTSSTDTPLDSVKAQVDLEKTEQKTEAVFSNPPSKPELMAQGESEAGSGDEAKVDEMPGAQMDTEEEKSDVVVEFEEPTSVVTIKKPADLVDLEEAVAVVDIKNPAENLKSDIEKPDPVVDVQIPAEVVESEKHSAEMIAATDIEKPAAVMNIDKPASKMNVDLDSNETAEAHNDLDDPVQTKQLDLNDSTTEPPEPDLKSDISDVPSQTRTLEQPQLFTSESPEELANVAKLTPSSTADLGTDPNLEMEAERKRDDAEMMEENLPSVKNGQVSDSECLKDDTSGVDARSPEETENPQTDKEPQETNNNSALWAEPTADCNR